MIQSLSDALAARGYETLTEVQEAVTAPELQDADLLVSAQTGSGKTVGFGLAIAHTLMGDAERLGPAAAPLALVVAPTRELAFQVKRELDWLYEKAGARVASCVGGMDMRDERRTLERGAHIVVGTPGRLRDHIQRNSLDMSSLRAIVLDEADEMLDLGFREDLEFMLGEAPEDRRTLLFSATVPPTIATLARQFQRDAVRVTTVSGKSQHSDITYQVMQVAQHESEHAIVNVLRFHEAQNAIVFANTRAAVAHLTARLSNRGFSVVSLSGELSQNERTHALQAMRDGRARVCVATDVAARGIDLPNLELVIHADLPSNSEGLLHRSGRTGRAGRKGTSTLIITPRTAKKAERLLKFAKIRAEWTKPPSVEEILRRDEEKLLADPIWSEEVTEDQAAFAAKLLALHSPEQLAAACLRLYRSGQSAPEELSPPDARPAAKERKPFGPSSWFSLSVGRDDRAEARWLLPLLCRAGNLDKSAIGAIRVQASETYVELTTASVPGVLGALGDAMELEDGIKMRQLDKAPDLSSSGSYDNRSSGGRPPRPERERRGPPSDRGDKPRYDAGSDDAPRKPRHGAAGRPADRSGSDAPRKPGKPGGYGAKSGDAKYGGGRPDRGDAKPARDKPRKGGFDKPRGAKPAGASNDRYSAAPAEERSNAADTSKRFVRPGKPGGPKPGGAKGAPRKPFNGGGGAPPRRKKP